MSSSCLESRAYVARVAIAAAGALLLPAVGSAAQIYVQPRAEARVESNSNRELSTGDSDASTVYAAEFQFRMGAATPRSDTVFRPWVRIQKTPDDQGGTTVEGVVALSNEYKLERGEIRTYASFDRRETANSEFGAFSQTGAEVPGTLDPSNLTSPETGKVLLGETRQMLQVHPEITYELTQRLGLGAGVLYQNSTYSGPPTTEFIDYDYWRANSFLRWSNSERGSVSIGPYVSRYSAKDLDFDTDGAGVELGWRKNWSSLWESRASVAVDRQKLESGAVVSPTVRDDTATAVTASVVLTRRTEVGQISVGAARLQTPSGNGGITESNQATFGFEQALSARLKWALGGGYYRDREVFDLGGGVNNWKYFQARSNVEWRMTRNWFIGGSYEYVWQRYLLSPGSADNHRLSINFGYEGLGRER